jgi:hypothetical protein
VSNHTPGPWRVVHGPTDDAVSVVGSAFVSWNSSEWTEAFWVHGGRFSTAEGRATVLANARLIAAAPEMFAALRQLSEYFTAAPDDLKVKHSREDALKLIAAAISKAEGA